MFVSDAWHPQINGVVRSIEATVAGLEALGHGVTVIGPGRFRTVPLPTYGQIRLALTTSRRLGAMIAALAPDIVHIATEGPLGWAARRYCLRSGIRFTTSYHTRFPEYLAARLPMPLGPAYAVLRRFHRGADAVLVATESLRTVLETHGLRNLRLWTRGVDTEIFRPCNRDRGGYDRPVLLYVGRIAVEKNLPAFLKLELPGTKIVVGDGPDLARLKRAFPDAVFAGPHVGHALAQYYAAADVFVFPSRTDTFGLVLLEALACGTPVAAFPVAGPRDVLAGQDPTAPVGSLHEDLAQAIRVAQAIPRKRCRDFALAHSWREATRQFLEIVSEGAAC